MLPSEERHPVWPRISEEWEAEHIHHLAHQHTSITRSERHHIGNIFGGWSREDETVEEDEDTHEEVEVVETASEDELPEESPEEAVEDATKIDPAKIDEVFVTGMTVGDAIKGSSIGTITGVTTVASDSTDTAEVTEEPAFDVSNAEPTTTSTSTTSANINSQGNARRQVNINAHGKHRRR